MYLSRRLRFLENKVVRSRATVVGAFLFSLRNKFETNFDQGGEDVSGERWTCSCGFSNFSFRSACFHCHTLNPLLISSSSTDDASPSDEVQRADAKKLISFSMAHKEVQKAYLANSMFNTSQHSSFDSSARKNGSSICGGDWKCGCGAHNFSRRTTCFSCRAPKNGQISFVIKPGDWICSACSSHNFKSRTECYSCHMKKPSFCTGTTTVPSDPLSSSSSVCCAPWTCQSCHSINEAHMSSCIVCTADRPSFQLPQKEISAGSSPLHSQRTSYPNDWICPSCSFINFQSRLVCKSCNAPKSEDAHTVGKVDLADGSNALTSSRYIQKKEDWNCECGFLNYSFRASCKSCSSPKPLVEVENADERQNCVVTTVDSFALPVDGAA